MRTAYEYDTEENIIRLQTKTRNREERNYLYENTLITGRTSWSDGQQTGKPGTKPMTFYGDCWDVTFNFVPLYNKKWVEGNIRKWGVGNILQI